MTKWVDCVRDQTALIFTGRQELFANFCAVYSKDLDAESSRTEHCIDNDGHRRSILSIVTSSLCCANCVPVCCWVSDASVAEIQSHYFVTDLEVAVHSVAQKIVFLDDRCLDTESARHDMDSRRCL